jgi:hypothetical protein
MANAQQVTLQNCDTRQLELEMPSVPAPFVLDDQFPTVLDPGQKATFSIAFRPQEAGPVERQLVIRSKAGDSFTVTLLGEGIRDGGGGDDTGGDDGTTSFYACGGCTSGDHGCW